MSSSINRMSGSPLTITHDYDDNSNRTAITHAGGKGFAYTYDNLNRETAMRLVGGGYIKNAIYNNRGQIWLLGIGSGAMNGYQYDSVGRLWEVNQGSIDTTTNFLYDGDALIAEYDGLGNILRRYVHGNRTDNPLIWYEGDTVDASSRRGLIANHQGSIAAVADSAGNAIAINGYDAYGIPNETNIGRFQYTGQIWLPELGLYYYKARIYSPTLGRFLQTDPIGYEDQYNLYAYVGNDPVNNTDPTGKNQKPTPSQIVQQAVTHGKIGHNGGPPLNDKKVSRLGSAIGRVLGAIAVLVTSSPAGDPNESANLRIQQTGEKLAGIVKDGVDTTNAPCSI